MRYLIKFLAILTLLTNIVFAGVAVDVIYNGNFNDGLDGWSLHVEGEGIASYDLDESGVVGDGNSVHVLVSNAHNAYPSGRIQLAQHSIPGGLEAGKEYSLTFKIKSSKDISNCFWTIYDEPDYTGTYYNWGWVTLKKDEIVTYSYTFTAETTDPTVYFALDFAAFEEDAVELWVDNISLTRDTEYDGMISNGDFSSGLSSWDLHVVGEGIASYNLDENGVVGDGNSVHVLVSNAHNSFPGGRIQLVQHNILNGIEKGEEYSLSFKIKSAKDISQFTWTIYDEPNYESGYYNWDWITLKKNEIRSYSYTFTAEETDPTVYLAFDFAGFEEDAVELWIDEVHLAKMDKQYTLSTETDGSGSVSINPPGGIYGENSRVEITAVPSSGWVFDHWGGSLSGNTNPASIVMNADKSVKAYFVEDNLPDGEELISNKYFDDGLNSWDLYVEGEGIASYNLDESGVIDGNSVHVLISNAHNSFPGGRIQLNQHNITGGLEENAGYHLSFDVKSSKDINNFTWTIYNEPDRNAGYYNWDWIALEKNVTKKYEYDFTGKATDPTVYLAFDFAGFEEDAVELWIDNIHLIKTGEDVNAFPPETSWECNTPNNIPMPGYLETVHDDEYGTDITCISDPAVFGLSAGSGDLLTHYPKDQAWNADMSKIIVGTSYVLDAKTYQLEKNLEEHMGSLYMGDSRWSNVDPDIRYFCYYNRLYKMNIETNALTLVHTFNDYSSIAIGPWEGNISNDDRYVVITDRVATKATLYDLKYNSVVSSKTFPGAGIDWASITPLNNYIVVMNNETDKTELYDRNFNYIREIADNTEHGDLTIDSDGSEVWVQVLPLRKTRLSDGKATDLIPGSWIGGHISGRGFDNTGWALVSTNINSWNGNYLYVTELFQVKLDGSGIIRHFGHARSSCADVHPFGCVRQDGKEIIFNSDWEWENNTNNSNGLAFVTHYSGGSVNKESANNSGHDKTIAPLEFSLGNYPNPFNPSTTIKFVLSAENHTKLTVYNVLGEVVKVIVDEVMQEGVYSVQFDGSQLPSGIYFYRLESGAYTKVKKMMLLK